MVKSPLHLARHPLPQGETVDSIVSPRAAVRRLQLANYRSYRRAEIHAGDGPIVLLGPNGAGKTNLLEAISFLTPGRGLRRAALDEVANNEGDGSWAVAADVDGMLGSVRLGTGVEANPGDGVTARRARIDREPVSSVTAFADHLRVIWLVPEMDGLFIGPASERRRFLDRLVLAIDATHGSRVNALERALRSRNRLLEDFAPDPRWLDAIEHEVAELGIAVAAARGETVRRLRGAIEAAHEPASLFPSALLSLEGWMEAELDTRPAIEVEDAYRARLREGRMRDRAAGRTLDGPHLSDLVVTHREKNVAAARASTGERKALLVSVVLSHARLVTSMHGLAPVVLLDDVAAFLDEERRAALFLSLAQLGTQIWITGVDASAFVALPDKSERFRISPGRVERDA
jgi:DNA replication and repair protein RecF